MRYSASIVSIADIFHTNLALFSAVSQLALLRLQEVACTEEGRGLEVAYLWVFCWLTYHRQLSKMWFCCTQWVLAWLCRWMFLMALPFEILIMWRRLLTQGKVHNCPSAILQFYSGGLFNIETTETNNILSDFIIAIDYTDNNRWHRQQWCHEYSNNLNCCSPAMCANASLDRSVQATG